MVWPQPATKHYTATCSPPHPSGMWRRMEEKEVKLMGWDKDSVIGQQKKRKNKNRNTNKIIHKARDAQYNRSPCKTTCSAHPQAVIPVPWPTPPVIYWGVEHHMVLNIPFGSFGSAVLPVSPHSLLWKLTLSQPKPGQPQPGIFEKACFT